MSPRRSPSAICVRLDDELLARLRLWKERNGVKSTSIATRTLLDIGLKRLESAQLIAPALQARIIREGMTAGVAVVQKRFYQVLGELLNDVVSHDPGDGG